MTCLRTFRCIFNATAFFLLFTNLNLSQKVSAQTNQFPAAFDTEKSTNAILTPEEAVKKFQLPPGFTATLFAGEPDVRQPIAFTTDHRGRLWVAESYTYADDGRFDQKLRDRIIILEDSDNDGRFNKRTVFWDQGRRLTSVAVGFGGIWALCAPHLLFIPDRNGDDIPDGEPEVVLDGWVTENIQHNIVNGLMWGPDGWLYGRHGILATSVVGKPGTPENARMKINCGIWRYHPVRKTIEAVAHGTTNPWGMDFDQHGEAFFINTVIGHLFHVIPGAHYKRMFGQDVDPFSYELIDQHADHYHWDTGGKWTESRGGKGLNDTLGGGHAHSGLMIYLGDNWPDSYRNTIFTVNLHGYRLNNDIPQRHGSGYVGKHGKDFGKTSDIWFRAVDLIYGADGGVFIADWSDTGECHEADGVHRSSGRIYKVTFGDTQKPAFTDLSKLKDAELLKLLWNKNQWYARQAQRILQERAASGTNLAKLHDQLKKSFKAQRDIPPKLRAMWALHVTGGADEAWLVQLLKDSNEHVRTWAVRFLSENPSNQLPGRLSLLAKSERSAFVRLAIASALQRIPIQTRAAIAAELLSHEEDANDHNLPLMIWYGISPLGESDPARLVQLSRESRIPLVNKLIARRLAENMVKNPAPLNELTSLAVNSSSSTFQASVVEGIAAALTGWKEATAPKDWTKLRTAVTQGSNEKTKELARALSLIFGDESAAAELKRIVLTESADVKDRRSALQKLIDKKDPDLLPLLQTIATNQALAPVAARGLVAYGDPHAPRTIIANYSNLNATDRPDIISTLVSRSAYAHALLDAVSDGKIKRSDISAYHARQIASLGDENLKEKLTKVWGGLRSTEKEKEQLIAKYKATLTKQRIAEAKPARGRELFNMACALCHKLYGEGKSIGPDLTGSGRQNLDYLLENIIDPGAIVAADYRMAVATLKDERILNGVISAQTERTITLQSLTETLTLERSEIADLKISDTSLMPEGILESLNETQTADLIAYLMSAQQVPLPK